VDLLYAFLLQGFMPCWNGFRRLKAEVSFEHSGIYTNF